MSPVRATTKVPVGAGALLLEPLAEPVPLLVPLGAALLLDEPAAEDDGEPLEPAGVELEPPVAGGGVLLVLLPVEPAGEQAASASAVSAAAAAAANLLGLGATTNLQVGAQGGTDGDVTHLPLAVTRR
jgi:hypothetical protein